MGGAAEELAADPASPVGTPTTDRMTVYRTVSAPEIEISQADVGATLTRAELIAAARIAPRTGSGGNRPSPAGRVLAALLSRTGPGRHRPPA